MQGKLYTQTTYESAHAWNHGAGNTTYRLVVDVGAAKPLVISFQLGSDLIHAHWGFDAMVEEDSKFVKTVDVPQDILDTAIGFIEASTALRGQTDRVKVLAE